MRWASGCHPQHASSRSDWSGQVPASWRGSIFAREGISIYSQSEADNFAVTRIEEELLVSHAVAVCFDSRICEALLTLPGLALTGRDRRCARDYGGANRSATALEDRLGRFDLIDLVI